MPGVLDGITVIEVGSGVALAFCGKFLADAGARVVKIEPPEGDPARHETPRGRNADLERSPLFLHLNTNKESVTLDLEVGGGVDLLARLAARADVLLESLPPGELASLGAGPEALREANPGLVVASITPYGQTGPMASYVATDLTLFASSGAMYREGRPEREPLRYAGHMPRMYPGIFAADMVLAALYRRRTTGRGDWIDLAEMDCWAAHPNQISRRLNYAFSQDIEEREDTKAASTAAAAGFGRGTYRCSDGYVTFLPLGDRHWPRLVELVERPELERDPRFATREARRDHRPDWEAIFQAWVGSHTLAEVFAAGQRAGIPTGPLLDAGRLQRDPHLAERGYWRALEHPVAGTLRYPGPPARGRTGSASSEGREGVEGGDDGAYWSLRRPAPLLGEHTAEVLAELASSLDGRGAGAAFEAAAATSAGDS